MNDANIMKAHMVLQSRLFGDDRKLEAAAVSDPAHIVPGATGDHVRKIQLALIRLDGATIVPDGVYGSATAAAVLAYKQKRNIINRSYQTKADDIVGPDPTQEEVIITQGSIGTIRVLDGSGGTLVRSQTMHFYGRAKNGFQVAKLRGAKTPGREFEEIDIVRDDVTATYDALNCGETFFQARVSPPQPPQKLSNIMRLLSLVDKSVTLPLPPGDYSPEPRLKSGLVSKAGTPLNPKPGRKINVFGEGESAGFEDYSSDIDFCSHTFSNGNAPPGATTGHRPWTADPRKPPGIGDKSVDNMCCRGSPIAQVTIDEILRIGAAKCRVTYAEAKGRQNCDRLRAGLAGAKVIDEGNWGTDGEGRAIVFELA
jgi:peptidoglycan hydrolase-like protein with peptidoglycan-binding domain